MKLKFAAVLFILTGMLSARTFTDISGKKIEAEFVSFENEIVTLSKDGQTFKIPLARFSDEDKVFIEKEAQQKAAAPSEADAAAAEKAPVMVNGKELKRGGDVNLIEAPLTEDTLAKTHKAKDVTSIKISIVLPPKFNPALPQKFLWISAAINNEEERTKGNLSAVGYYASTAIAEGWAVIAVDCNLGNPVRPDRTSGNIDVPVHHQAIAMLSAAWPGFSKSTFACAGFSGGSKMSFYRVGDLATGGLNVAGLFLGGCNEDRTDDTRKETKVHSGALRKVKVFVSNGKQDTVASVEKGKAVGEAVKKHFGAVRIETYEGDHSLSTAQLKMALAWFIEPKNGPAQ